MGDTGGKGGSRCNNDEDGDEDVTHSWGNPEESLHESDNEGRDVNSPSNDPQDQGRGEVNAPRHRSTSSS